MKELLEAMGLTETVKPEDAVKHFQEKFIPKLKLDEKEQELTSYREKLGTSLNQVDTVIKRYGKQLLGEDLGGVEHKEGMKSSELAEQILSKAVLKIKDSQNLPADVEKQVKEWQTKAQTLESAFEAKDKEVMNLNKMIETLNHEKATQLEGIELRYAKDNLYSSAKWSKEALDYTRNGFKQAIEDKYLFERKDGKLVMKLKATGEVPKNTTGTDYLQPSEILQKEMQDAKLWQEHDMNGGETKPWQRQATKEPLFKKRPPVQSPEVS